MTRRESLVAMLGGATPAGLLIWSMIERAQAKTGHRTELTGLLYAKGEYGDGSLMRCTFWCGDKQISRDAYLAENKRRADAFFTSNGI